MFFFTEKKLLLAVAELNEFFRTNLYSGSFLLLFVLFCFVLFRFAFQHNATYD